MSAELQSVVEDRSNIFRLRRPLRLWLLIGWVVASAVSGAFVFLWEFDGTLRSADAGWFLVLCVLQANALQIALPFLLFGLRRKVWKDRWGPFLRFFLWFPLPPILVIFLMPLVGPITEYGWRAKYILPGPMELMGKGASLVLYLGLALPAILSVWAILGAIACAVVALVCVERVAAEDGITKSAISR